MSCSHRNLWQTHLLIEADSLASFCLLKGTSCIPPGVQYHKLADSLVRLQPKASDLIATLWQHCLTQLLLPNLPGFDNQAIVLAWLSKYSPSVFWTSSLAHDFLDCDPCLNSLLLQSFQAHSRTANMISSSAFDITKQKWDLFISMRLHQ